MTLKRLPLLLAKVGYLDAASLENRIQKLLDKLVKTENTLLIDGVLKDLFSINQSIAKNSFFKEEEEVRIVTLGDIETDCFFLNNIPHGNSKIPEDIVKYSNVTSKKIRSFIEIAFKKKSICKIISDIKVGYNIDNNQLLEIASFVRQSCDDNHIKLSTSKGRCIDRMDITLSKHSQRIIGR